MRLKWGGAVPEGTAILCHFRDLAAKVHELKVGVRRVPDMERLKQKGIPQQCTVVRIWQILPKLERSLLSTFSPAALLLVGM
jgi:hypothetical protein